MEADVNKYSIENPVVSEDKHRSVQLQNLKLPLRVSLKKHQFRKQSWVLPEGQTVLEKENYLHSKKTTQNKSNQPNVVLYFDLFITLKQLLRDSLAYLEASKQQQQDQKITKCYENLCQRVLTKKRKVNDLLELYIHQQHMRAGATNLLDSLQEEKRQVKGSRISPKQIDECLHQRDKNTERLLAIQGELNLMSGTFKFHVLGLIGFSRVIPGDVYEISFKHAEQKTKSKCKITSLGQTWTNSEFQLKSNFSQELYVKISESSKTVGSIACPMQEFITSQPQVYILPLNVNATLKLKIGILWSPIDNGDNKYIDKHQSGLSYRSVDFNNVPLVNITSVRQRRESGNVSSNFAYSPPYTVTPHAAQPQLNSRKPLVTQQAVTAPRSPVLASNNHTPRRSSGGSPRRTRKDLPRQASADSPRYSMGESPRYSMGESPRYSSNKLLYNPSPSSVSPSPLSSSYNSGLSSPFSSSFNSTQSNSSPFSSPLSKSYNEQQSRNIFDFNVNNRRLSTESSGYHSRNNSRKTSQDNGYIHSNGYIQTRSNSDDFQHPIKNEVRVTKVPLHANKQSAPDLYERDIPQVRMSGNVTPVKPNNYEIPRTYSGGSTGSSVNSPKSPPIVKPKPRQQPTTFQPAIEDNLIDVRISSENVLNICQKILSKLKVKKVISLRIEGLEARINDIMQLFNQTQPLRRPSLTESINSALDSFDFLNRHDDDAMTIKSGISGHSSPTTPGSPTITAPRQWKKCYRILIRHLYMLYQLISDFVQARGPLICVEQHNLKMIERQLFIISEIYRLTNSFEDINARDACLKYSHSSTLNNTWEVSVTQQQPLYCTWDEMFTVFMTLYQHIERESQNLQLAEVKEKVCLYAMDEITQIKYYGGEKNIISLYQFVDFFKNGVRTHNVVGYLKDLQQELICFTNLISKDDMVVISTLQKYHSVPVVEPCIYQMLTMIASAKSSTKGASLNALLNIRDIGRDTSNELIELIQQCLEERKPILRAGACMALGKLKVNTSSKQLMYVNQHDDVPLVQDAASMALKELGFGYRPA